MAAAADVRTVIANGSRPGVLGSVAAGEDVGTQVLARATSASAFKLWLRYAKPVRGTLEIDAGAARALAQGGSSLLPVGVKRGPRQRSSPATPWPSSVRTAARSPGGSPR